MRKKRNKEVLRPESIHNTFPSLDRLLAQGRPEAPTLETIHDTFRGVSPDLVSATVA